MIRIKSVRFSSEESFFDVLFDAAGIAAAAATYPFTLTIIFRKK
jgi:hypothetical protein